MYKIVTNRGKYHHIIRGFLITWVSKVYLQSKVRSCLRKKYISSHSRCNRIDYGILISLLLIADLEYVEYLCRRAKV